MIKVEPNPEYLKKILLDLLSIPSPSGYCDRIVQYVVNELKNLEILFKFTNRGSIRAVLPGMKKDSSKAVSVHLDTLGAMVTGFKENGRLTLAPIGSWSSRFAEGGRVTVFTDQKPVRGTVLPNKASGHVYGEGIDHLEVSWDQLEIRVDERCSSAADLKEVGCQAGDVVAFDPMTEISEQGFINSRFLDDKAGVAIVLSTAKAIREKQIQLPVDCHILFTLTEEIGTGASSGLPDTVSEMVSVDLAPLAPRQNSSEFGVTLCAMDKTGPFDQHLTNKLAEICREFDLEYAKDVFRFYRSDSAAAIDAGFDIRTALVAFGVDSSHGYERTHMDSLVDTSRLISLYLQSSLVS